MERKEVEQIVERAFAENPNKAGLCSVRSFIIWTVAERNVRPKLSEERCGVFAETFLPESLLVLFGFMAARPIDAIALSPEQFHDLISIYKISQRFLEFLMDNYDQMSEYFRNSWSLDNLVACAAEIVLRRELIEQGFKDAKQAEMDPGHISFMQELIAWVRAAFLGEEQLCFFSAECTDAIRFARESSRYEQFFKKDQRT